MTDWRPLHPARSDGTILIELYGLPYHLTSDDATEGVPTLADALNAAAALSLPPEPGPDPIPSPPVLITRRQLRLVLLANGITTAHVEAAIDAIPDEIARETARIEWADATTYERDHPLVDQIGDALGLTPEQIDTMWAAAATL